jgi:hypothetical protein
MPSFPKRLADVLVQIASITYYAVNEERKKRRYQKEKEEGAEADYGRELSFFVAKTLLTVLTIFTIGPFLGHTHSDPNFRVKELDEAVQDAIVVIRDPRRNLNVTDCIKVLRPIIMNADISVRVVQGIAFLSFVYSMVDLGIKFKIKVKNMFKKKRDDRIEEAVIISEMIKENEGPAKEVSPFTPAIYRDVSRRKPKPIAIKRIPKGVSKQQYIDMAKRKASIDFDRGYYDSENFEE